jgi:hypothetical protein
VNVRHLACVTADVDLPPPQAAVRRWLRILLEPDGLVEGDRALEVGDRLTKIIFFMGYPLLPRCVSLRLLRLRSTTMSTASSWLVLPGHLIVPTPKSCSDFDADPQCVFAIRRSAVHAQARPAAATGAQAIGAVALGRWRSVRWPLV